MASKTILPKKSVQETLTLKNDDHYEQLAIDPSIPEIPSGTRYESLLSTGNTTYGTSSAGGSYHDYSSTISDAQSNPAYGNTTKINTAGPLNTAILTESSPTNSAAGADVLVNYDNDSKDWINKRWRPLMAYVYMITCFVDFIIFPILWSILQAVSQGNVTTQWQPLTLQGAGLYHVAMGAVLGIAAYGRTKEKLEGVAKH